MGKKPDIKKENIKLLCDAKYVKLFDMEYEKDKHYFIATRNSREGIAALKNDEDFRNAIPDAVSCAVILKIKNREPVLLLAYEYRYPTGRFLLSPTAGLVDEDDKKEKEPLISAAKREIFEETGITVKDTDRIFTINPLVFSTPGMTDESNGLVCAVISREDTECLTQKNAVGTELFDGFITADKEYVKRLLRSGRDENGNFYSLYTWAILMYFVSDLWKEEQDEVYDSRNRKD